MGAALRSVTAGIFFLAVTVSVETAFALDWNNKIDSHVSRFYGNGAANPDFVGDGYDWTGVGILQSGGVGNPDTQGKWITMISDTYFLSAYHVADLQWPVDAHFYPTNNIGDGYETGIQVDDTFGEKIAGTDLWLGRLTSQPSPAIARYPLIKRNDSTYYPSYLDPTIYVVGYADGFSDYNYFRLGTSRITGIAPSISDSVHGTSGIGLSWVQDPGAGPNEVSTIGGDSSGPTFVKSPVGKLALAGIHFGPNTDTNVSDYVSQIASAVSTASSGQQHVSVMTDLVGDFNADYSVNVGDLAILGTNYNQGGGRTYAQGDITGDGYVDANDLAVFGTTYGKGIFAPADFNKDSHVDYADALTMAQHWKQTSQSFANGDANGDGTVDEADLAYFNANTLYVGGAPGGFPSNIHFPGDFNHSGVVDVLDQAILTAHYPCLTGCTFEEGDITGNGTVNVDDLGPFYSIHQPTYVLDTNGDGIIGMTEAKLVFDHFGQSTSLGIAYGDFNQDGVVNSSDLQLLIAWYGVGANQLIGQQTVPEPSTIYTVGWVILIMMRRRNHRR